MRREKEVEEIAVKMKEIAPWATTILYGSEARGDARPGSDIDLLILVPDDFSDQYNKIKSFIMGELYMIELKTNILISPLVLLQKVWQQRKTPFTCNIENEGLIL